MVTYRSSYILVKTELCRNVYTVVSQFCLQSLIILCLYAPACATISTFSSITVRVFRLLRPIPFVLQL